MKIQTATNEAACEKNSKQNIFKFDINVEVQKFEQSLHREKSKERQYYDKWYGILTYVLFFFTFSIMGWIWEVALHFVQTGEFVKRGVLYGPWLPIYGSGGVLVLILLRKVFKNPICTFFLIMLLSSIIEYTTSWVLEMINGVRWWDYSGYFMNINGRICLEGVVVFGIGGCMIVYIVAPNLERIFKKVKLNFKLIVCTVLMSFFIVDAVYSIGHPNMGKGVTAGSNIQIEDVEN